MMPLKQDPTLANEHQVSFDQWVKQREISCWGTNSGAPIIAFQGWKHFKEAFAPELIKRAITESEIPVKRCVDPFGGSGTTALACQFLGVHPITIEVNPYLADLIEAKLTSYNMKALHVDFRNVVKSSKRLSPNPTKAFAGTPQTFVEPGDGDRWIFDTEIARRIAALRAAIGKLDSTKHRRLFLALLGGVLIEASNVVISGKGRRYRRGWDNNPRIPQQLDELFIARALNAIEEIQLYSHRKLSDYILLRGDSRNELRRVSGFECAIFSPPYPNSFDYTDVYNVELWALGYLTNSSDNSTLRKSTLSSHVQILRKFSPPPEGSKTLNSVLRDLVISKDALWSKHIPAMVGGYFADMHEILAQLHKNLSPNGKVWMVVGDSRYAGIQIPVAKILTQLSEKMGFACVQSEPFRSMRVSPQQGGQPSLDETLVILSK